MVENHFPQDCVWLLIGGIVTKAVAGYASDGMLGRWNLILTHLGEGFWKVKNGYDMYSK